MQQELVARAVESSFLAEVPVSVRQFALERARLRKFPPGHLILDGQDDLAGIVVSGMLRVFLIEGSSVTLRNVSAGEAIGLGALLSIRTGVGIEAVTVTELLEFDLRAIDHLRKVDVAFVRALAREAMRRLADTSREVALRTQGTGLQLTARHLLDLAAAVGSGEPVRVSVTHQGVADGIGMRRETVTRTLATIERVRVIRLARGAIEILDPAALRGIAHGEAAAPKSWTVNDSAELHK